MIFGIGTDIVRVARMQSSLEKFGDRFAKRILSEDELPAFADCHNKAQFLAKRFAAKEAAAKALGTGFRDGIALTQMFVTHDDLGRPLINFSGKAQAEAEQRGISAMHLSIADESEYAVAYVILEYK